MSRDLHSQRVKAATLGGERVPVRQQRNKGVTLPSVTVPGSAQSRAGLGEPWSLSLPGMEALPLR